VDKMASPFETVILKLKDLGAFQFLFPFMLTAAVFYGLLRKSQVFGEPEKNIAVNAVVALVAAFMVWAYPILSGVNVETQLSTFFVNASIAMLTVVVGLMIAGLFFKPDLVGQISATLNTSRKLSIVIIFGILVGGAVLLSSGLVTVFIPSGIFGDVSGGLSQDTILTIAVLVVVAVVMVAIIAPFGGGKKES